MVIQSEQKLIGQADELIVLSDSSKFKRRSSLLICSLNRIDTLITDERIDKHSLNMLDEAGINVIVAELSTEREQTG